MARHAILLASEDWCVAASSGRVKVYDFKERRKGIRSLTPGSVCVVMAKPRAGGSRIAWGEFTVVDVREVDAEEYARLAERGLIYNPQRLAPGDRRWVIFFDEFREYARKVPQSELVDVKTSTSREPVSEWVMLGLSYIDDVALEGIRRRAGGFIKREALQPGLEERVRSLEERVAAIERLLGVSELALPLSHECLELMLITMGKQLGFSVYTADPSRTCGTTRLGDLADLSRKDLEEHAGKGLGEPLSQMDVVWYRKGVGYYIFEVVIATDIHSALVRFSRVGELNAKLFIVADESRKSEYEKSIAIPAFQQIRDKCNFIPTSSLLKMYILTSLWKQAIKELQIPT